MLTIISILIVYITLINSIILITFLFRKKTDYHLEEELFENSSVIIAIKNEAKNLKDLIDALKNQTLNKEKFEVIIVDDYSDDNSLKVLEELIKGNPNFKILKNKYASSKKNALRTGIEEAKNDILIFTDADCIPQKDWLKTILKNFDYETDIVYGFSPFLADKSFTNKLCRYENIFTSILISSFQNIDYPYMSFGRNFAYRKSLFNQLGGFREIEHSLSGDDDLFFQLAIKNGAKAKLISEPEAVVFTKCGFSFSEYVRRKSRHLSASKYYLPDIKAALAIIYGSNILVNFFLIPTLISLDSFLITFIILNWLIKVLMIYSFIKKLKLNYPIHLIPVFDFIYFILLILISLRSRFKISGWK